MSTSFRIFFLENSNFSRVQLQSVRLQTHLWYLYGLLVQYQSTLLFVTMKDSCLKSQGSKMNRCQNSTATLQHRKTLQHGASLQHGIILARSVTLARRHFTTKCHFSTSSFQHGAIFQHGVTFARSDKFTHTIARSVTFARIL